MDACARACVCVYAFMCTCNARSQVKNSKKMFVSAQERIQKSKLFERIPCARKRVAREMLALRFQYASIFDSLLLQVRVVTDC